MRTLRFSVVKTDDLSARRLKEKGMVNVDKLYTLVTRGRIAAIRDREEGQALVEYALLLSLIAVASIGILQALGLQVANIFSSVNNAL